MKFLIRLLVTATALWVAVQLVSGIEYHGHWAGLLAVALVFGIVNAFVRPVLFLLTCPLVLATLGLFLLVLNGMMLWLTGRIAGALGIDFTVHGILPAILGALVVTVVSVILNIFVGDKPEPREQDA